MFFFYITPLVVGGPIGPRPALPFADETPLFVDATTEAAATDAGNGDEVPTFTTGETPFSVIDEDVVGTETDDDVAMLVVDGTDERTPTDVVGCIGFDDFIKNFSSLALICFP